MDFDQLTLRGHFFAIEADSSSQVDVNGEQSQHVARQIHNKSKQVELSCTLWVHSNNYLLLPLNTVPILNFSNVKELIDQRQDTKYWTNAAIRVVKLRRLYIDRSVKWKDADRRVKAALYYTK